MPNKTIDYEVGLRERLKNPEYACEYLLAALEDDEEGSEAVFLLALRDIAQANHMAYVADATGLNRESLYKMLSKRGNPGINSLKAVLSAVGLKLSVQVAAKPICARSRRWVATWTEPQEELVAARYGAGHPVAHSGVLQYRDPELTAARCESGLEFLANPPPDVVVVSAADVN
jgi:probable addiction module antidote protein